MIFSIAIRTCNRSPDYLGATLANLRRSSPEFDGPLEIVRSEDTSPKLTPNETARLALKAACRHENPWVLFVEDDVDFCDDFIGSTRRWLADHVRDDRRLYPLFCPYAPENVGDAWDYPIGSAYGSQAYVLRREDGLSLVDYLEAHPLYRGTTQSHDLLVGDWARGRWPAIEHYLTPVPSFVQHVGRKSVLAAGRGGQSPFFDAPTWKGREWRYKGRFGGFETDALRVLDAIESSTGLGRSVLDLGCGPGAVTHALRARGVDAIGIDRPECDLRRDVDLGRKFDSVLCWEVAEHLPEESAPTLCATIARHAGDKVFFSAAVPGQGGYGHVNEQPHGYWLERLAAVGLKYREDETIALRAAIHVEKAWWYPQNMMVLSSR